jgi:membrane protein YqaA with SNARE-associated domain
MEFSSRLIGVLGQTALVGKYKHPGFFRRLVNGLIAFGPLGLFGLAFLDSALLPLPLGPDAAMMLLTAKRPELMLVYALAGTIGSVAGCLVLYFISRRAGGRALKRFSPAKQERVKSLLDRYDVLALFVASILPPPFPFKVFIISSGVFRLSVWRFALGVGVGRAARFLLEGALVKHYGGQIQEIITRYFQRIGLVGIGLVALVAAFFVARSLWRRRRKATGAAAASNS